ncbi:MAG: hypothetical protein LBO74_16365 [Candidatus Symbiothrix sp.]|jgi:hypothetical protein|nr:hypothetical protein [Candidatus Symbiothrix sp.]
MKKMFLLLLTFIGLSVASVNAQVRIGGTGTDVPTQGSVLDLNATVYKGGLLLPNVSLTTLTALTDLTPPVATPADLKGLIVYNTNPTTGEGIYVWNGSNKWEAIWKKLS